MENIDNIKETILKNVEFLLKNDKLDKGVLLFSQDFKKKSNVSALQCGKLDNLVILVHMGSWVRSLNQVKSIETLLLIKNELAQIILKENAKFLATFKPKKS